MEEAWLAVCNVEAMRAATKVQLIPDMGSDVHVPIVIDCDVPV